MREDDFENILESLKGYGTQQNKYDGEELELTDVFTDPLTLQL